MERVLVGLSGGVDSSVVVARLRDEGFQPVAATLVMQHGAWPVPSPEAVERARVLAESLDVEHRTVDVSDLFERAVVRPFVEEYACGRTPNPCIVCNPAVKFRALAETADSLGCERIATGHYAALRRGADGSVRVARGSDPEKDQSYFLYRVPPVLLERCMFPLADVEKRDARAFARDKGLPAADAKESTGVCFAPGGDYRRLIAERRPDLLEEGPILDARGSVLGTHGGAARFTVGQRKGLGLSGGPWFVSRVDRERNAVIVEKGPLPPRHTLYLRDPVLWCKHGQLGDGLLAQTRYHASPQAAAVVREGGRLRVDIEGGAAHAAEGQSCVLYDGDVVVGGGFISWT